MTRFYARFDRRNMSRPMVRAGWVNWRCVWVDLSWGNGGSDAIWSIGVDCLSLPVWLVRAVWPDGEEWG